MLKPFLECGKIVAMHGLQGEVKVQPWCDSPAFLQQFQTLYFDKGKTPVTVLQVRVQKSMAIVKFKGFDTLDGALCLRGKVLYMNRADVTWEEGRYFVQDLIGLQVYDADDGRLYGELRDVSATGANDVYHIRFADGREHFIPAIPQVVIKVDVAGQRMEIRPLPGLFEETSEHEN